MWAPLYEVLLGFEVVVKQIQVVGLVKRCPRVGTPGMMSEQLVPTVYRSLSFLVIVNHVYICNSVKRLLTCMIHFSLLMDIVFIFNTSLASGVFYYWLYIFLYLWLELILLLNDKMFVRLCLIVFISIVYVYECFIDVDSYTRSIWVMFLSLTLIFYNFNTVITSECLSGAILILKSLKITEILFFVFLLNVKIKTKKISF